MKTLYLEKSLGIDIREGSVSLALLGKTIRGIDVLNARSFPIALLGKHGEKAEKIFLEETNRFLMEQEVSPENVVVSLPRGDLTFQTFELPAPNRATVDSMVGFELERHFSSSGDDLYFAYHASPKKENLFHIACAAVKREIADYYIKMIRRLSLRPQIVDVSTYANLNLVQRYVESRKTVEAILDLDPRAVEVTIIKNGIIEFSRYASFDDPDFRRAYFEKDLPEEHYETLSTGLSQILVEEVQNTLSSCRNVSASESIERIHLLGGGPFAPSLARCLEEETEVSVTRGPIPQIVNPDFPDSFSTAFMATALSLALRELKRLPVESNLLPENAKSRRKKARPKTSLILAGVLVLVLIGMVFNDIIHSKATLASLHEQLAEIKQKASILGEVDVKYDSVKQYIETLNSIDKSYPPKLPILLELTRVLPSDTWLTSIKISKNKMEIKGFSSAASKLVPIMEKSPRFREAGFVGSIVSERGGEKFTIRVSLKDRR